MKIKMLVILMVVVTLVLASTMLVLAEEVKKIDINIATLDELETLPGIGPKLGQAIIDGRPYEKVEDLLKVEGITDKKLAEFQDLVEVPAKVEDIAIVNLNTATLDELETLAKKVNSKKHLELCKEYLRQLTGGGQE